MDPEFMVVLVFVISAIGLAFIVKRQKSPIIKIDKWLCYVMIVAMLHDVIFETIPHLLNWIYR